MRRDVRVLLFMLLIACPALAQAQRADNGDVVTGSLDELRDKRRVLLLVRHSSTIDAKEQAKSILAEAYEPNFETQGRLVRIHNMLTRKLNKYMVKHKGISAVRDIEEADFIILFNLLEYRRPLGNTYPYGEMFVILNNRLNGREPRIIWKTRHRSVWAEDAINEFIKDLKAARGET